MKTCDLCGDPARKGRLVIRRGWRKRWRFVICAVCMRRFVGFMKAVRTAGGGTRADRRRAMRLAARELVG